MAAMLIQAVALKPNDVIVVRGEDWTVREVSMYRKQGRKWVNLMVFREMDEMSTKDLGLPGDVMVPFKGPVLF